jgi:hypothetical protein
MDTREECHWSHACSHFKRAGVGTNGILECKFLPKTSTMHYSRLMSALTPAYVRSSTHHSIAFSPYHTLPHTSVRAIIRSRFASQVPTRSPISPPFLLGVARALLKAGGGGNLPPIVGGLPTHPSPCSWRQALLPLTVGEREDLSNIPGNGVDFWVLQLGTDTGTSASSASASSQAGLGPGSDQFAFRWQVYGARFASNKPHSRLPLVSTPARLKRASMRVTNDIPLGCPLPLTCRHCTMRPHTEGPLTCMRLWLWLWMWMQPLLTAVLRPKWRQRLLRLKRRKLCLMGG